MYRTKFRETPCDFFMYVCSNYSRHLALSPTEPVTRGSKMFCKGKTPHKQGQTWGRGSGQKGRLLGVSVTFKDFFHDAAFFKVYKPPVKGG